MTETFDFILTSLSDLDTWLSTIGNLEFIQNDNFSLARNIIEIILKYLLNLELNIKDYKQKAFDCVKDFEADHEFKLNKIHKSITNRVSDYIFILNTVYQ